LALTFLSARSASAPRESPAGNAKDTGHHSRCRARLCGARLRCTSHWRRVGVPVGTREHAGTIDPGSKECASRTSGGDSVTGSTGCAVGPQQHSGDRGRNRPGLRAPRITAGQAWRSPSLGRVTSRSSLICKTRQGDSSVVTVSGADSDDAHALREAQARSPHPVPTPWRPAAIDVAGESPRAGGGSQRPPQQLKAVWRRRKCSGHPDGASRLDSRKARSRGTGACPGLDAPAPRRGRSVLPAQGWQLG
jgi:hypothetical protein